MPVHLQVGPPLGSCASPVLRHLPGSCCLQSLQWAFSPSTMGTTGSQEGRWQRGHPPPQQSWAWETLPNSPQDVSLLTLCPSCLWPPLLFPAPGGEEEPGWELRSRAFTFPLPSLILKSFSSKMIRQVGAALPVGCCTSPSHGMHAWPQALPSSYSHHSWGRVPSMLGHQDDKSLSIHPTLGRVCPWSLSSIHQDGNGRSSPYIPLPPLDDIKGLKKRSGSVQVSASLTGQGGGHTKSWQPGSAEGQSWRHLLHGCQRMGAMGKAVSWPFGDRAVAPQCNNPLL